MTADRGDSNDDPTDRADGLGICVVTHPLAASGENATRTLLEILDAIAAVELVTAYLPEDSTIRERHDVTEISRRGAGDSPAVAAVRFLVNQLRMCRAIHRSDAEVVLFFGATAYVLPVAYARAIGRTVVIEPRGNVPLTLRLSWERRVPALIARGLAGAVWLLERIDFRLADAVVTYTPGMAAQLGLDPTDPTVYPMGARYVDTDAFSPTVPFEERECRVGFVGRLAEEKGVRDLAAVARALPERVSFRFVGDGPLRPWLERELADEIASGRVEVTGWIDHDEIPAALNGLRLLVLPSDATEGLPTTILEAFACGTPAYATPVSGVPDVVRDGDTGYLMAESDPEAIAARIGAILERDDLVEVAANGRRLVERDHSYEAAVARYRRIVDEICG